MLLLGQVLTSWRMFHICEGPAAPTGRSWRALPLGRTRAAAGNALSPPTREEERPPEVPPASQHLPTLPTGYSRARRRGLSSQLKGAEARSRAGGTSVPPWCGVALSITVCWSRPQPTWHLQSLSTTAVTRKDVRCEREGGNDGHTRSPRLAIGQGGQAPHTLTAVLSSPPGLHVLMK